MRRSQARCSAYWPACSRISATSVSPACVNDESFGSIVAINGQSIPLGSVVLLDGTPVGTFVPSANVAEITVSDLADGSGILGHQESGFVTLKAQCMGRLDGHVVL